MCHSANATTSGPSASLMKRALAVFPAFCKLNGSVGLRDELPELTRSVIYRPQESVGVVKAGGVLQERWSLINYDRRLTSRVVLKQIRNTITGVSFTRRGFTRLRKVTSHVRAATVGVVCVFGPAVLFNQHVTVKDSHGIRATQTETGVATGVELPLRGDCDVNELAGAVRAARPVFVGVNFVGAGIDKLFTVE